MDSYLFLLYCKRDSFANQNERIWKSELNSIILFEKEKEIKQIKYGPLNASCWCCRNCNSIAISSVMQTVTSLALLNSFIEKQENPKQIYKWQKVQFIWEPI